MVRDADDPMASPYEVKTRMENSIASAIRVDQIDAVYRLREVDPEKVTALKASIEEIGLRTPIHVTGDGAAASDPAIRVRLVAGAHRLEAMRQLGREWIGVHFCDGDDLDAELWEIDENLCRAELTPADRALFVFRRKEIYLMKHPETGHGGDRASRQVGELKTDEPKRFTTATAQATGQSERAIQRDAERGEKISEKALRMLRGTHHDKGVTLDRLKALRPEEQEVYVNALFEADRSKAREAKEIRDSKQKLNRSIRTEIIKAIAEKGTVRAGEMPRAAFPVLYADPPWEQEAYSDETGQDRGLRYPAMPLDDIKDLCAGEKSPATRDAILLLWTTASRLRDGLDVMAAWGFTYKSHLIWDKVNIGMGRWVRDRHELLLIGTRGDFPGLIPGTQPHSLYSETKTEHSVKPTWFAAEIDRLFPDLPKLELFQRKDSLHFADVRRGETWSFWGYEAGGEVAADSSDDFPVAEPAPEAPPADPVKDALVAGGFAPNAYHLALNGLVSNRHLSLPSRLLRHPVDFISQTKSKDGVCRLFLRHPLLGEHADVAPYLAELEQKTGLRAEWEPLDEFGRDRGEQYRWFHAVDLCNNEHWQDLLATRHLTDEAAMFGAVRMGLEYKGLSLKNARSMMAALEAPEPDGRSVDLLSGDGLWPFQDGKKKYVTPNIKPRGADGAWLCIHGLEDGWLNYAGKFLSVSPAGMARREQAKAGMRDVPGALDEHVGPNEPALPLPMETCDEA